MRATQRRSSLACLFSDRCAWHAPPAQEPAACIALPTQQGLEQALLSLKAPTEGDVLNMASPRVVATIARPTTNREERGSAALNSLEEMAIDFAAQCFTTREGLCHATTNDASESIKREKPPAIARRRLSGELLGLTCGCDRFGKKASQKNRSGRIRTM